MSFAEGYAPLWVKSNYSFLEGASHPDELVDEAHRLGLTSMALTDREDSSATAVNRLSAMSLSYRIMSPSLYRYLRQ